jgi:hypothetical protein
MQPGKKVKRKPVTRKYKKVMKKENIFGLKKGFCV